MAKLGINLESIPLAGAEVAASAVAESLTPMEIMHRLSEQWLRGAKPAEKAETLRVLLRNYKAPEQLISMLEGSTGERVVSSPLNKVPRAILRAAGTPRKQAEFTRLLTFFRGIKPGGASAKDLRTVFGLTLKAAEQAGLPADAIDALKKMGPEKLFKAGPTSVARVYDVATKDSSARRLLRWAAGEGVAGPTKNLSTSVRAQIDEIEGMARSSLSEEVAAAEGKFGRVKAGARGVAGRAGEALSPKGLTGAEEGTLGQLTKAGAKGLGKGAKFARKLGGVGAIMAVPLLGYELYDSLVGKSKRARAALEASRRGGTASVSQELMYDILDKRADLSARRAMLAKDPAMMQKIIQSMGGTQAKVLTGSEAGYGVDMGSQGTSPGDMDKLLDQLLGQMRGM